MKIVIIADAIDDQQAGIFIYAKNLIENLLTIDKENEYWFIHNRPNPFFNGQKEVIVPIRGPIHWIYRHFIVLPNAINKIKPDVVHGIGHFPSWMASIQKIYAKKVVTIFDLTPILFKETHTAMRSLAHKLLLPLVFRKSDHVITISESSKKDIIKKYSPVIPIAVTYLASRFSESDVDSYENQKFRAKYKSFFPYVLHVGTIEPRKNLVFLIEVFNQLKIQMRIPHKLILVGENGWKSQDIFQKMQHSLFSSDIIWLGHISNEELPYWYNNATVCVYPSLYEGFGLPPLEAMSLGCPAVVSNVSSLPEVVGGGGVLCEVNNLPQWVAELKKILTDENYRQQLIESGYKKSAEFSWERCAGEMTEVYLSLIGL